MSILFDSASLRNTTPATSLTSPAAFGFGVSVLDHTPRPIADILADYAPAKGTPKPFVKYVAQTTKDEAWDLGYRLTLAWDGNPRTLPLPPKNYEFGSDLRAAFLDGADAAHARMGTF